MRQNLIEKRMANKLGNVADVILLHRFEQVLPSVSGTLEQEDKAKAGRFKKKIIRKIRNWRQISMERMNDWRPPPSSCWGDLSSQEKGGKKWRIEKEIMRKNMNKRQTNEDELFATSSFILLRRSLLSRRSLSRVPRVWALLLPSPATWIYQQISTVIWTNMNSDLKMWILNSRNI